MTESSLQETVSAAEKFWVEPELCIACDACCQDFPEVFIMGGDEKAHPVDDQAIGLYNLACYCSLDGQRERALVLLDQAIDREAEFREHARTESDLDPIREDPEFRRIIGE